MEGDGDSVYRAGVELAASSAAAPAPALAVAESQSLDYSTARFRGVDNALDHCMPVPEIYGSQLVGVSVTVAGDAVAADVKSAPAAAAGLNLVGSCEKRKRGRPAKGMTPTKPRSTNNKMEEEESEDVCFICFDGGSLVLCDRKGCPKAYHPPCIKRDEVFFRSKAKWNCGWHICSICQKGAHYMCYTCTYSLCKGCTKEADFLCVRRNMGLCTTCMRTIMLIENKDQANTESVQVDFDDKTSWEYLFKVYWILLKEKYSLTLDELTKAKDPWKGVASMSCKQQLPVVQHVIHHGNGSLSNGPHHRSRFERPKEQGPSSEMPGKDGTIENTSMKNDASLIESMKWASKELLEFVAHMKSGDTCVLSQFDVQVLLLEYIKKNNLRDPHRRSQIICDLRLKNLFGKPRVGHIEMLKLLEFHISIKDDSHKDAFIPAGSSGNVSSLGYDDNNGNSQIENKNKKPTTGKKVEERAPQNNLEEFAAIDVHNINLIYLCRGLMANLIEDEKFNDKVVGSIVRIRISSSDEKQDLYRLVKVVGTSKVDVPYKIGEKTTNVMLVVLNLNKKEDVAVDAISSQDFSEEECRRLRQSIRCRLVKYLTVGEIQLKAMELQAVRLNDWLEEEILKLNHISDQASEQGRRKELGECIEKLQLLKTPEERQRRLCEIPEVHTDPKMNPDYESEEDAREGNDKKLDEHPRPKHSGCSRSGKKLITLKGKVKEEGLINHQRRVNQKRDESGMSLQAISRPGPKVPSTATAATSSLLSTSDGETETLWHYRDPCGKIQGPFSMMQLRKWSVTGYFPPDMRIWTINEQDDSILLTDALIGNFHTAAHLLYHFSLQCQQFGAASDHRLHSADVGWNENIDRPGNSKQIVVALQCNHARVQPNSKNEFVRTDGLASLSSCSSMTAVSEKEMQLGISQHREMKEKNSSLDHFQEFHVPPSSNTGARQVPLPHEGQVRGSEGSTSSPLHENKVSSTAAAYQISDDAQSDNGPNCNSSLHQSSGQNWRTFPINLNSDIMDTNHGFSPVTNTSEQDGIIGIPEFPGPLPNDSIRESGQFAEKLQPMSPNVTAQVSHMRDLPSPIPTPIIEIQAELAESKQPIPAKVAGQDSGPSWGSACSLVVGGAQLPEIADDLGRYSATPARPSVEEWSSGLVSVSSLKQPEVVGDQATPTSNINPLAHTSPSHPTSNWHMGFEPIEFSTLAEESVSDLLAEVDAMESQSGLASPTSAMRCRDEMIKGCKNDCFSIEGLSPSPDPGKSDSLSCTGDIQLPCQSTVTDERVRASQADAYDASKWSSGHSTTSSEEETKSALIPANQGEAGSAVHTCSLHTMSRDITGTTMPRSTTVTAIYNVWERLPGHVSQDWRPPPQGNPNIGWGTGQGAPWGNLNFSHDTFTNGIVWDGQWKFSGERYAAPMDWVQSGELGYGKSRPLPKEQRACKLYESGHCKKGGSCDYLHP